MNMDNAARWGLPEGFVPVRSAIPDDVKELLRPMLSPGELAVVALANAEDTVTLIGTQYRLFVGRSGATSAGVTGYTARELPWAGVTKITLSHAGTNVKLSFGFRTSNGRDVEVGRRAAMGRDAVEHAMPFESSQGQAAYAALYQLWQHATQAVEST